ncbi:hypothetical protein POTOM_039700 [Populus tomentosa]|uniref:YTH domain-containing family protein n=1 Tax=Populus tomentosa TaxID=118781 RepID=A0A8X8CJ71_POPTO|nr:hypothetical protein POTOM_039700 [Populus tomentosa]
MVSIAFTFRLGFHYIGKVVLYIAITKRESRNLNKFPLSYQSFIFLFQHTAVTAGCAKMTSKIGASVGGGNWKYAHGTAHYGRNFSVKWLKLCELSFHKTRHLRNPFNENLPVKVVPLIFV